MTYGSANQREIKEHEKKIVRTSIHFALKNDDQWWNKPKHNLLKYWVFPFSATLYSLFTTFIWLHLVSRCYAYSNYSAFIGHKSDQPQRLDTQLIQAFRGLVASFKSDAGFGQLVKEGNLTRCCFADLIHSASSHSLRSDHVFVSALQLHHNSWQRKRGLLQKSLQSQNSCALLRTNATWIIGTTG